MSYYDNPEGYIPTWLINWVASTGGPQYLTLMHKSCIQYSEWRKQRSSADTPQAIAGETKKSNPIYEGANADA